MAEEKNNDVKRPMNSFLIFCDRYRASIRKMNPTMDNRNVTRALGDLWANLGDEQNVYKGIAKQQKDAFMMANPGYKWHNNERKSQNATKKAAVKQNQAHSSKAQANPRDSAAVKPPSFRLHERVDNVSSDVCQNPAELAEPSVNVLNQTQMSEQDKSESQNLSASFLPLETSTPMPIKPVSPLAQSHAAVLTLHPPMSAFLALLEVAEMRLWELGYSSPTSLVQPAPRLGSSTQCHSALLYQPSAGLTSPVHRLQPPLRKRALSLIEADLELAGDSWSCPGEDFVKQNLPKQNSFRHSGSSYTRMRARELTSPRRKQSASAKSPSSLCSFGEDTEKSHMFPQIPQGPECSMQTSYYSNEMSATTSSLFGMSPGPRTPQFKSKYERHRLESILRGEIPRQLYQHDRGAVCARPCVVPCENCFDQSRQLGMSHKKSGYRCAENLAPGASSTHVSDNYLLGWKLGFSEVNQPKHPHPVSGLNELIRKNSISPSLSPDDKPFSASSSYLVSLLSQGRAVSLLSNNSAGRPASAGSEINHCGHKTLQKIENMAPAFDQQSVRNTETDSQEQCGQFRATHRSGFVNENDFIHGWSGHPIEPESSLNSPPSQAANFSEGKLKKKWEERMLVEIKQREFVGCCQSAVEHFGQDVVTAVRHASPMNVTHKDHRQKMSLDCVTESEHSYPTDRLKMHQEHWSPIVPVEQKPILNQSLDANPSEDLSPCNSNRYSRLRQQLSQNLSFLQPDLPRLQSPYTDVQMKPEQGASGRSSPDLNHSYLSSSHQQSMDNSGTVTEAVGLNNFAAEDPNSENDLNHVSTRGTRFMGHILEQFLKTDFSEDKKIGKADICEDGQNVKADICEDRQNVKTDICEDRQNLKADYPGLKFPCDESSSAAAVKSKNEQKCGSVLAGLREGIFDRFHKDNGLAGLREEGVGSLHKDNGIVDYNMTASSLVEKAIREFCGSSSPKKDARDSPRMAEKLTRSNSRQIDLTDASHMTTKPDSLSSQTITDVESSGISRRSKSTRQRVSSCANGEDSVQCMLSSATIDSSRDADVSDQTIIQPIRKSGRANRGQKYQEFIKEGIIQPSRDRLASRNGEKLCTNLGSQQVSSKVEARRVLKPTTVHGNIPARSCAPSASPPADNHVEELTISRNAEICLEVPSLPGWTPRPAKRKLGHSQCDDDNNSRAQPHCDNLHPSAHLKGGDNHRMMTRCRRNALSRAQPDNSSSRVSAVSTSHPTSSSHVSAVSTSHPTSKGDSTGSGCSTAGVALPKEGQDNHQIRGSQKRKARQHSITHMPAFHEAKEDLKTPNSSETLAVQHKKSRLSSELQMLLVSRMSEVSLSSWHTTISQAQLTGVSSAADVERRVASVETFIPPDLRLSRVSGPHTNTEFSDTPEASFAVDSCQADLCAYSSSDVSVGKTSCMNFTTMVNSTFIISSMPITSTASIDSSTPIIGSTPFIGSTPIISSMSIQSSTPSINSMVITSTAPIASSTPIMSSTPMVLSEIETIPTEFTTLSDPCRNEQERAASSDRQVPKEKLQICAKEPANRDFGQVSPANDMTPSCAEDTYTLKECSGESQAPLCHTTCNSPLYLHSVVDASSVVEENNSQGDGQETSLLSHVKSILECSDTLGERTPTMAPAPRKAWPAQWSPSFKDESIFQDTQMYQQDSKQCYDTTDMYGSTRTSPRESHFSSLLSVIEICRAAESPVPKKSSPACEITFAAEPDLMEGLPAQPSTSSQCHNRPSSSRFVCSNRATSDKPEDRPSSSTFCSVGNKLSPSYSSPSAAPSVMSLATPIVNFAVKGTTPVLENVSPSVISSPHLPESPPVTFVQS